LATTFKVINDQPPVWDGRDAENHAVVYLKQLKGWLRTTRTMKSQRGMVILNYTQADLKLVVDELDIEILTSEDGGEQVYRHIEKRYCHYLEKRMPRALERALYSAEGRRGRGETLLLYTEEGTLFGAGQDRVPVAGRGTWIRPPQRCPAERTPTRHGGDMGRRAIWALGNSYAAEALGETDDIPETRTEHDPVGT
jgi:hypothetical protein